MPREKPERTPGEAGSDRETREEPTTPTPTTTPPDAYPMSLDEFVQTYERGREVEMKAGFRVYAIQEGFNAPAPLTDWVTRYETFRTRPVS
jgi:hypothetical protein